MKDLRQVASEENLELYIDVSQIPQHIREVLAEATLKLYQDTLSMPNGREILDRKKEELALE